MKFVWRLFSVGGSAELLWALVEPSRTLTEIVIVGHTLVDASSRTASVLMVNPNVVPVSGDFGGSRGSGPRWVILVETSFIGMDTFFRRRGTQ